MPHRQCAPGVGGQGAPNALVLPRSSLVQQQALQLNAEDDEAPAPAEWMDEPVARAEWERLGLDAAPFTVQADAPMHLVHFYVSQLTLNCVFVVDKGRFVGMINKADMVNGNF